MVLLRPTTVKGGKKTKKTNQTIHSFAIKRSTSDPSTRQKKCRKSLNALEPGFDRELDEIGRVKSK